MDEIDKEKIEKAVNYLSEKKGPITGEDFKYAQFLMDAVDWKHESEFERSERNKGWPIMLAVLTGIIGFYMYIAGLVTSNHPLAAGAIFMFSVTFFIIGVYSAVNEDNKNGTRSFLLIAGLTSLGGGLFSLLAGAITSIAGYVIAAILLLLIGIPLLFSLAYLKVKEKRLKIKARDARLALMKKLDGESSAKAHAIYGSVSDIWLLSSTVVTLERNTNQFVTYQLEEILDCELKFYYDSARLYVSTSRGNFSLETSRYISIDASDHYQVTDFYRTLHNTIWERGH